MRSRPVYMLCRPLCNLFKKTLIVKFLQVKMWGKKIVFFWMKINDFFCKKYAANCIKQTAVKVLKTNI